ncbi:MAG: ATP-binding protein [Chthoniobacteraceae bacterium]|jgi:signal transduction histidine kinase
MTSGFLEKLIERIGRIRPEEVQNYLLRLAHEKGFFETIFNAIHEGVIVTDTEGNISFVNDAACELFGLDRDDCMGRALSERITGLDWPSLAHSETIISRDMEVFYPQNRFINFYVAPISLARRDDDEPSSKSLRRSRRASREPANVVGYAIILRDITETRRTTEQTIESERLNALTLLAAGVAHEIGNPLNSLTIHLQLMERKIRCLPAKEAQDLQESVRIAREEITRLDYIVNQFLRAIRPTPLDTTLENLNVLVEESLAFLAPELKDRDILVETELRHDLPLLPLDRHQIKQAFYNIIKNAAQAMKSGGIFHIRTDRDEDHVSVTFNDTGGGIPAENMSKVFDPYFTTKQTGSGLGLLIVRRIVREHGGEIDMVNNQGRGLQLTIRLPLHDRRIRMLAQGESST